MLLHWAAQQGNGDAVVAMLAEFQDAARHADAAASLKQQRAVVCLLG